MDQPALPGFGLPSVVEVTLRVGIVADSDHLQWQMEVRNPVTNELLAMESRPHFPSAMLGPETSRMTLALIKAMRESLGQPAAGPASASED